MMKRLSLLLVVILSMGQLAANPPTPNDDLSRLLSEGMPFAKQMLTDQGEFFPYANAMAIDGAVVAVAGGVKGKHPSSQQIIDALVSALHAGITSGEYKAGAIFVNVRAQPPGQNEMIDAVRVGLEHIQGLCMDVYVPYTNDGHGGVSLGKAFASQRTGQFITGCK